MLFIAVVRELYAADKFHDKKRPPRLRRASIENFGNVRMIHHRERLPLLFEAGDHLLGIHAHFDDLQSHAPTHGLFLLGHPHGAKSALTDLLEKFVVADPLAGLFGRWREARGHGKRGSFQKRILAVIGEQLLHRAAQRGIVPAGTVEEGRPFCRRRFLERLPKEVARVRSR